MNPAFAFVEPLRRPLTLEALEALASANVRYVLLRGFEELWQSSYVNEVDVLVAPDDLATATSTLRALGYAELPAWGHAPHRFFVNYFAGPHEWVKLDVVTALIYGRPTPHLSVDHELCLRNRTKSGTVFVPDAADELAMLLLHCILDKAAFRRRDIARIESLHKTVVRQGAGFCSLLWQIEKALPWAVISNSITKFDFDNLLNRRRKLQRSLGRRELLVSRLRQIRNITLRRLRPAFAAVQARGMSVALVAPDGAGKTTLAKKLADVPLRARYLYMGRGADTSREGGKTFRFARRLTRQWIELAKARMFALTGSIVIFDRFSYDRRIVEPPPGTVRKVREWLLQKGWPSPELVIVLDAPGTVLYARKGEHSPAALETQRHGFRWLADQLPQSRVIDATRPLLAVEREITSLVWDRFRSRGTH